MKVLMVSDAGNIHTKRWAVSLAAEGVELVVFSITIPEDDFYYRNHIRLYTYDLFKYKKKSGIGKAWSNVHRHFKALSRLKEVIGLEKPDILHAHYATSYGLIAAMSGFHPFILSVWGSDVYEYPYRSVLKKSLVRYTLKKADRVLSTSHVMALQTRKFCNKAIGITPFGVDTGLFRPADKVFAPADAPASGKPFVFGTVKTLAYKYGIDLLISAFANFVGAHPDLDSRLVIAGKGKDRLSLEKLAERCHVADKVDFLGEVSHDELPALYNTFDIAVFLSREESFGVSVVEAMSCGCPVIVSDADGFREIVEHERNGLIVPRYDIEATAQAMSDLAADAGKRAQFSKEGRKHVVGLYEWRGNVRTMLDEYRDILAMED